MSWHSCIIVFVIAFIPGALAGIGSIREAYSMRYQYPFDRFRDHLATPVPSSVSNLHFLPLEETIRPNLHFEFDIAAADLDSIIEKLQLERVDIDKMFNPDDFFQHAYFLPVVGNYQIFQKKNDVWQGKEFEILTIKTNESHTHAIFRRESTSQGKWEWESHWDDGRQNDELQRLKQKFKQGHTN